MRLEQIKTKASSGAFGLYARTESEMKGETSGRTRGAVTIAGRETGGRTHFFVFYC
uniref:Uncharacterized protein n=1 Tax=Anguilla anguilla TaxID=7936 RepID=A0A0E9RIK8_ANGAN